jgi:hypothetical protein
MRAFGDPLFRLGVLALAPILAHAAQITAGSVDLSIPGIHNDTDSFNQATQDANGVNIGAHLIDSGLNLQNPAGFFPTSADGTVQVSYGSIKVSAAGLGEGSSIVSGRFRDLVTFTAPGVPNGTPGTFTYGISTIGGLNVSPGQGGAVAASSWDLTTLFGSNPNGLAGPGGAHPDIHKCGELRSNNFAVPGYVNCVNILTPGDPFGTYSATVSFLYGSTYTLDVFMELMASSGVDFPTNLVTSSSVDMAHSIYWGGVSGVTANGAPVNTFTITSSSGVNYANSFVPAASGAPEPGTLLLCAAALGMAVWKRRG